MRMSIRAGLLSLLAAAAVFTTTAAYRTLRPKSRDELPMQIYAAIASDADTAEYFLKSCDGHVAIYSDAKYKTAPEMTRIETAELRSADRAMLERGIPVADRRELLGLLEDLGS